MERQTTDRIVMATTGFMVHVKKAVNPLKARVNNRSVAGFTSVTGQYDS